MAWKGRWAKRFCACRARLISNIVTESDAIRKVFNEKRSFYKRSLKTLLKVIKQSRLHYYCILLMSLFSRSLPQTSFSKRAFVIALNISAHFLMEQKVFFQFSQKTTVLRCLALNEGSYYNSHKQYVNANNTEQESVFMAFLFLFFSFYLFCFCFKLSRFLFIAE